MRLRSLIGGIALSLFAFCAAPAAFAQTQTCADPVQGMNNVNINETGACTITTDITVPGTVSITAGGVVKITGTITAGGSVTITGNGTSTQTAAITATASPVSVTSAGTLDAAGAISGSSVTLSGNTTTTAKALTATAGAVSVNPNNTGMLSITGTITATGPVTLGGTTTTAAKVSATGGSITATATTGALTFNGELLTTTSGGITLSAPSIASSSSISSAAGLDAQASSSDISITGAITLNTGGGGQNTFLFAQTNLSTSAITSKNTGGQTGAVDIKVNQGGANTPFTVGASGTNGVGNITAVGVFITNGTANSTGGVTFSGTTPVKLFSSTSTLPPNLLVDAKLGTITLPALTLSASGASGLPGGNIFFSAATISALSGATITASQDADLAGSASSHIIVLGVSTTNFGGTGLSLAANGNGGGIFQSPTGSVTFTDNENINELEWGHNFNSSFSGNLVDSGAGTPLSETANGSSGLVQLAASSIAITSSALTLQSQGATGQQVALYTGGALTLIKQQFFCKFGVAALAL